MTDQILYRVEADGDILTEGPNLEESLKTVVEALESHSPHDIKLYRLEEIKLNFKVEIKRLRNGNE